MGATKCESLFPTNALNHPEISREMKETFIPLAQRAGSPDEVDSCDMESYYEEHKTPTGQRHSSRGYFLAQTLDRDGYAQLDFDYNKFFGHLIISTSSPSFFTLRSVGTKKDLVDRNNSREVVQILLARRPDNLFMGKVRKLMVKYPFWNWDEDNKVKDNEPLLTARYNS